MDIELKCNRLTCRTSLTDKAVVTTCSHIFCVNCANELFNASRLCPACETSLTEPDDVVVCSLQPTNDYKTSVLSGLSPSTVLEICSRAISFWQYQIHQENSFQQAVVRSVNDKNAQLQRQLDNVVREANSQIELLMGKKTELEKDLEFERKKVRELQDAARDQTKEYQKLKAQMDKIKRKALLGVNISATNVGGGPPTGSQNTATDFSAAGEAFHGQRSSAHMRGFAVPGTGNATSNGLGGGMQSSTGVQRTPKPIGPTGNGPRGFQPQDTGQRSRLVQRYPGDNAHRQQLIPGGGGGIAPGERNSVHSFASLSERSGSAQEVEGLLMYQPQHAPPSVARTTPQSAWPQVPRQSMCKWTTHMQSEFQATELRLHFIQCLYATGTGISGDASSNGEARFQTGSAIDLAL